MPHLIGVQLHSDGISVAALRPDQTIVLRPVNDMASVIRRTSAQRWKWSLAVEATEAAAMAAGRELFLALQQTMGDEHILAGVAVPATWNDRARRALILAVEGTSVEIMRLVRDTTALAVAASLLDPPISGLCAIAHVGTHKLEVTLAEVAPGTVKVLARQSVSGLDGSNMRFEMLLPLITEVANVAASEAGIARSDVRRFVCSGRRAATPSLANALGGVWGVAAEVFPAGTIALGAAQVAAGLSGMSTPWNLLDDLDEAPIASLRSKARRTSAADAHGGERRQLERSVTPTGGEIPEVARRPAGSPSGRIVIPPNYAPRPPSVPQHPPVAQRPPSSARHALLAAIRPPSSPHHSPLAPIRPPSTPHFAPPSAIRTPSSGTNAMRDTPVMRPTPPPRPSAQAPAVPPSVPPPPPPEDDDSRGAGERVNDHPSYGPPPTQILDVGPSGAFVGLPTLDAVRALHLLHPAEADGLRHPTLAALLNQFTFLRSASGTLTLRHRGDEVVLPIERGGVCLAPAERTRALRSFDWPDGTFTWHKDKIPWTIQKHRGAMTAFVVAGLRVRLRDFDDAVFTHAHAAKLRMAPTVISERRSRLARLALPEAEERAVDHVLDGQRSFEKMLGEGYVGRTTMQRLVVLLDLYGILHWGQVAAASAEDPLVAMNRLLATIEAGNHFVALGVHWSAPTDEIREAWEAMQAKYGPGGSAQRHDPTLAARIIRRGAAAWAVLRADVARVNHRREAYPGMDEELLAPLVEARAKALAMRGEKGEADRMMRLRGEFRGVLDEDEPPKPKR